MPKPSTQTIPKGWQQVTLGDDFFLKQGKYLKNDEMVDSGFLVYGANGVIGSAKEFMYEQPVVLVSCRGANCGVVHLTQPNSWVSNNSIAILPKTDTVDTKFLYYKLFNDGFEGYITGSAQPQIVVNVLSRKELLLPILAEQKKIAEILSAVDDEIQKTDEIIFQTEKLKRGLMRRLLNTGRKVKLKEVSEINKNQINPLNTPEKLFKYIDIGSINNFQITSFKEVLGADAPSRAKRIIQKDDILFSTVRPNLRAIAYINFNTNNFVVSTGFCALSSIKNVLHPKYLYYSVQDQKFTEYLVSKTKGSNYPAVNPNDIADYDLRIPEYSKQVTSVNVLSMIDEKITKNLDYKVELTKLKNGLMQDLLSGSARVNLK
jgi:type I restriction enzyme, S subunit